MDPDEALEHIEDATPGEDIEAWIAHVLAAEVRKLRELADEVHLAWTSMTPEARSAVRAQSDELYDALGYLSTYVVTRRP